MTIIDFLTFVLYFVLFISIIIITNYIWILFKRSWIGFVRADFFSKQNYLLFEIQIPRGQTKSPLAMELFMNSLYQTFGEATWKDRFIKGSTKAWFSLELVSLEGQVKFFIWTRDSYSNMIRTQLYAQFPDIGIKEIYQGDYKNDYVHNFTYDLSTYKYWCGEFIKKNAGHLPIKTYIDYGLDKDPKEEFKIDPITPVLEYLGSLDVGEYAWIQIGVLASGKTIKKPMPTDSKDVPKFRKDYKLKWYQYHAMVDWTDEGKAEVLKLTKRDKKMDKENPANPADSKLTKSEMDKVDAVERGLSKLGFETGIRAVYFAKKDNFQNENSSGLMGSFRQYNSVSLNSFEVKSPRSKHAWMDKNGAKVDNDKKIIFEQYKARSFFYPGYIPIGPIAIWKSNKYLSGAKPFIMTSEELATIFHFPGDTNKTSNVSRIDAKKVEAPANLPI